jgi:hypothetical protein
MGIPIRERVAAVHGKEITKVFPNKKDVSKILISVLCLMNVMSMKMWNLILFVLLGPLALDNFQFHPTP